MEHIAGNVEHFVNMVLKAIAGASFTELAIGVCVLFIVAWALAALWGVRNPVPARNYQTRRW